MGRGNSGLVIGDLLRRAVAAVRLHPIRHLLLLGVVPLAWGVALERIQALLLGANAAPTLQSTFVGTAWQSVVAGGLALASIELAAGGKAGLAHIARGIRFAPLVFLASLAISLPMFLFAASSEVSLGVQRAAFVLLLPVFLVAVRGMLWVPFIVDRRETLVTAFQSSWAATRGSTATILLLFLLGAIPFGFLFFVLHTQPILTHLLVAIRWAVELMLVAHIYLALAGRDQPASALASAATASEPAAPAEDLPVKGSGRTRDANDDQ